MKEVIYGKELRKVILEAADLICNAVISTLGPSGNNVLINKDDLSPYITNDGVTIAESISSNDPRINTVLEIIKESSLKTNETVGDGTTTTLVLLQAILKEGYKEIDKGGSPIKIKRALDAATHNVINELNNLKRKPSKNDLINVASISANDKELGSFITEVFLKMKSGNSIKIEESLNGKNYYEIKKGYSLEIDNIPSVYFKDKNEINLKDAYILLLNGYLKSLEDIGEIINEGLNSNKGIVILASDFEESLLEDVILYNLQVDKNIFLFKIPNYGTRKAKIMEDLSALSNSKIIDINYESINASYLKRVSNIIIKPNEIVLVNNNENIKIYLKDLKKELKNAYETYEKDFLNERISKLDKGIATIYIGASTKTETKEKIMRSIDALCALNIASSGIVVGEGITFLKISEKVDNNIMKISLKSPFMKIMENAGEDAEARKSEIIKFNYEKIFNFDTLKYDDISSTLVNDPVLVSIEAIKNASSIAGMLLTTNYLVINESFNKEKVDF